MTEGTNNNRKRTIIIVVVACVICAALAFGITFGVMNSQLENQKVETKQAQTEQEQKHVHDWVAEYKTVHHDAETHIVHHDAVYENQTLYSTFCNTCNAELEEGKAQEHISQTGHAGFTKNVPHVESVLVKQAWDETITDKEAYDETVLVDYKCASCDATTTPDDSEAAKTAKM